MCQIKLRKSCTNAEVPRHFHEAAFGKWRKLFRDAQFLVGRYHVAIEKGNEAAEIENWPILGLIRVFVKEQLRQPVDFDPELKHLRLQIAVRLSKLMARSDAQASRRNFEQLVSFPRKTYRKILRSPKIMEIRSPSMPDKASDCVSYVIEKN